MLEDLPIGAGLGGALSLSMATVVGSLVLFETRQRLGRAPLVALISSVLASVALLSGTTAPAPGLIADPAWLALASVWPLVALVVHLREGIHRTRELAWAACLAIPLVALAGTILERPAPDLLVLGGVRALLTFVDAVAIVAAWEIVGRRVSGVPFRVTSALLLALTFDAALHSVALALLSGGFEGHVLGGLVSAVVASLLHGALGAFWLLGVQGERWLRVEDDRPVLDVLSVMLGTRHYVPLRPDVVRDASSGLYDRTFLEDSLVLELERAEHLAATVVVLLLDTDDPPAEVGRALLAGLRLTDLSCRWGPRRYLALLPGADRASARSTALRIAGGLPGDGRMGLAVYPDDGVNLGSLIDAATRRFGDVPRHAGRGAVS